MKRKSGQHRPEKKKQARSDGPIIQHADSFTQLELAPMQAVTFTGSAVLEVTAGCLSVFGALVTPESGPVKLHAPINFGRALQLTALAAAGADTQPPRQQQPSCTRAVLHPLWPTAEQQQQQQGYAAVDAASEGAPVAWQVPPPWAQAVGDLVAAAAAAVPSSVPGGGTTPLSVAVAGSKGAGKSAFARLLVNSLLCQGHPVVAFLDLDPGQPEFTTPGLVSLQLLQQPVFGPPHLQQQQPLLAFFLGDTSSQSEPGRYLQQVQALVSRYRCMTTADLAAAAAAAPAAADTAFFMHTAAAAGAAGAAAAAGHVDPPPAEPLQQLPPLVINTPGWITGLGLELLAEVLRFAQPTHVVQLQTANPRKDLPASAWWLDTTAAAAAAGGGGVLPVVLQVPSAAASADAAGSGSAAAPADSCVSGFSGDTTQAAGGKGGVKGVSAAAARNLMWLAWAERAAASAAASAHEDSGPVASAGAVAAAAAETAAAGTVGTSAAAAGTAAAAAGRAAGAEDFASVAAALAAAVPMVVSLQELQIELLHAQVAPAEMPVALNGALVGLARSSGSRSSVAIGPTTSQQQQEQQQQEQQQQEQQQQQQQLAECVGVGLVRAVDGPQQELYVLTDLSEQQLQQVDMLQVGKLQLPDKLLEAQAFASPYQGLFCLASAATGAGQIKSRNNLLRSSQLLR